MYAVWAATPGWDHTLNDRHSFRQSQTATTALYLVNAPLRLAYETPVLGKPWSIPMEFPIYQTLVAKTVEMVGSPLDQTGRLVSLLFFIFTCVPLYFLFRHAGVSSPHAWIPLILFIVSPFYIFWSRTFMIESTALFFAVAYLTASLISIPAGRFWAISMGVCLGIAAALTKVTTFVGYWPWIILLLALQGWRLWQEGAEASAVRRFTVRCLLLALIPLGAALLWLKVSDGIKAANPLAAAYLTSTCPHNSLWNYGSWDQKFSMAVWGIILGRFYEYFSLPHMAWLLLGLILAVTLLHRRRSREIFACVGGYLLAPAIFTNVHAVHDYYANANGIFLIAAAAFALVGLFEENRTRTVGRAFLALFIVSAVLGHRFLYLPIQERNHGEILEVAERIQSIAPNESVLICIGNDWSPLVSYYSRRRALNFPINAQTPPELFAKALENLKEEKIGAIVLLEPLAYPRELAMEQIKEAGLQAPLLIMQNLPKY